jgi:hypothetical protein
MLQSGGVVRPPDQVYEPASAQACLSYQNLRAPTFYRQTEKQLRVFRVVTLLLHILLKMACFVPVCNPVANRVVTLLLHILLKMASFVPVCNPVAKILKRKCCSHFRSSYTGM